jgi:hypothetical protein
VTKETEIDRQGDERDESEIEIERERQRNREWEIAIKTNNKIVIQD